MKKIVIQAIILALLSASVGLIVNAPLLVRWARGEFGEGFVVPKAGESVIVISQDQALDLFQQGQTVFIDSRSAEDFARGHVPRARNIPLGDPRQEMLVQSLGLTPSTPVVVYCSGGPCLDSLHLAQWMTEKGYLTKVMVFSGGWEAWAAAGFPIETSDGQK